MSARKRREQLDVALADVEQHRLDALLGDHLAVAEPQLEAVAVELERGLELLHGDADVVDAAEHRAAVYSRPPSPSPAAAEA